MEPPKKALSPKFKYIFLNTDNVGRNCVSSLSPTDHYLSPSPKWLSFVTKMAHFLDTHISLTNGEFMREVKLQEITTEGAPSLYIKNKVTITIKPHFSSSVEIPFTGRGVGGFLKIFLWFEIVVKDCFGRRLGCSSYSLESLNTVAVSQCKCLKVQCLQKMK